MYLFYPKSIKNLEKIITSKKDCPYCTILQKLRVISRISAIKPSDRSGIRHFVSNLREDVSIRDIEGNVANYTRDSIITLRPLTTN